MQVSILCGLHEELGARNLDRPRKSSEPSFFAINPNGEKAES